MIHADQTDPLMVRLDNVMPWSADTCPKASQSSLNASVNGHSQKRKKEKQKSRKRRQHIIYSSTSSPPRGKHARQAGSRSVLSSRMERLAASSPVNFMGKALDSVGEAGLAIPCRPSQDEQPATISAAKATIPMEVDPVVRLQLPGEH